uniref:Uncharacterized protein n=1 Tax=Rhizophora mucronata TaxID=61149 RepID=A0A2P2PVY4_RHIMU
MYFTGSKITRQERGKSAAVRWSLLPMSSNTAAAVTLKSLKRKN